MQNRLFFGLAFLSLLGFIAFISYCKKSKSNHIPLKVLFGSSQKSRPQISPDGSKLAYLAPINGIRNIFVKTLGKDDDRAITNQQQRDITNYFWNFNNNEIFYLQDKAGNENWHIYSVDLNTKRVTSITPFEGIRVGVISYKKQFPDEMLISMNKRDPKVFDVYKLDLKTKDLKMVVQNSGNITDWTVDEYNKVRAAKAAKEDGSCDGLVRDDENSPWRKIGNWGLEDDAGNYFFGFSKDGKFIYASDSRNANTSRLIALDAKTGEIQKVIYEDPNFDFGSILRNKDTGKIQLVTIHRAKKEWIIFDKELEKDIKLMRKLDEGELGLCDRDKHDKKWIISFIKDNGPVSYWLFDRETKKSEFLFCNKPELKKYKLAKMEPISFVSRDGFTIHGYLTKPVGFVKNLPLILNVHGGPWARDFWGYNPEVQFLANRGHAVLQVNFRGSTGYGKNFVNIANKQWGAKMHDDLVDAVDWAVKKGIADPKKVAIYGGSYGGYAALVGATFTPDLFCCAIDIVGPSNLVTLLNSIPPYWKVRKRMMELRIGSPETEKEFLESVSPLFKADKIKIPVMVVQGANDPRVKKHEAEQIVTAMEKNGVDYKYLLFEDEGHGLLKECNRMKFYEAAEKFLAKNMG